MAQSSEILLNKIKCFEINACTANMYSGRAAEKPFFAVILEKNTRISLLFQFVQKAAFFTNAKIVFLEQK